jgi:hypothetical protein
MTVIRLVPTRVLLSAFLAVACVAAAGSLSLAATGCSKSGGDATGPTASACSDASFDSSAGIGFNLGCNSVSVTVSGITYDQFSRRTSYNYDMACSNGSNRKTGRVYNITYNNLGQPLTWDYSVNGTTCRKA